MFVKYRLSKFLFSLSADLFFFFLFSALICQEFLDDSASQLTYHGLSELASRLKDNQLAVFFRNNHFSTIYKHKVINYPSIDSIVRYSTVWYSTVQYSRFTAYKLLLYAKCRLL